MNRAWVVPLVALMLIPRVARSQGEPVGPEFHVNTYTTGNQSYPATAFAASGGFVVVWESDTEDGVDPGVYGQRYGSSGAPLGPEFRVNTYTTGFQGRAAVASDSAGDFVVVWNSTQVGGGNLGIFGQRYGRFGAPLGPEFPVTTNPTTTGEVPSVASDASGDFVVVWDAFDGSSTGVFGQRYASTGAPLGSEFRVNTATPIDQRSASVASDSSGNFVVVWQSYSKDSNYDVIGQRFASSGTPLGTEFRVNAYTTGKQLLPVASADSAGNFVVAWQADYADGNGYGIFGQRFASTGPPLGSRFQVTTATGTNARKPSLASDAAGNFVVTWISNEDGSNFGVFARRFASSGSPLGLEFRVNTFTTTNQFSESVAADPAGNFVVVWESYSQEGVDSGIYGQRYGQIAGNTISFAQAASNVAEAGGSAAVAVVISTPDGQPAIGTTTVGFATADGTAVAGADYGATSGTLSFPAGTPNGASQTINVPILDDALDEADETFAVGLANAAGGTVGDIATHTVTILDDDPTPSISIGDSTLREGSNGTVSFTTLPVELSAPSGQNVSVDFSSSDGTATAGSDYEPISGTLVFGPGETSAQLTVSVLGDDLREVDETYTVDLSNPVNVTIADGQGLGTILDDDSWPELTHGHSIQADLQAQPGPTPDTDLYSVSQKAFSSYEVVVDGTSGELGPSGPTLERIAADGMTVLQGSSGSGASRSLRWENSANTTNDNEHIRVQGSACGVACDAAAVYRIRLYDTTASIARFNNSGTQTTLLLLQSLSDDPITGDIRYWGPDGTLLGSQPLSLPAHALRVVDTSALPALSGQSGSVTIGHDGSYGALAGKAVAVEPATGFTFDTPLLPRAR